jgi:hypothetical protein
MPRNTSKPTVLIAVTASGAARALSLPGTAGTALIREAILLGQLSCFQVGARKLIPVFSGEHGEIGLQEWFLKFPRAQ